MPIESSCNEYEEVNTTTLEWTLKGLRSLFDSSRGETKSKVTKSIPFGGGRWQILFYPNSGTESGAYVSLYLSCEATAEEKDNAISGKWMREGLYKFSFEMRTINKTTLFNSKEACDHSFSYKTANWGWAQFARRDSVYYQANTVKKDDAFLIICTITSSPSPPSIPSSVPRLYVPRDLLDAVGSLLDDPVYSDVEFVLPGKGSRPSRSIWACRRLLRRAEYFNTMFGSGFAEGIDPPFGGSAGTDVSSSELPSPTVATVDVEHQSPFDDSDEEDEDDALDTDAPPSPSPVGDEGGDDEDEAGGDGRNVRAKLSHPSSPRTESQRGREKKREEQLQQTLSGQKKIKVVIKDVAYSTYKAVLYYLYTDTIVFAPLSSNFLPSTASAPLPTPGTSTSFFGPILGGPSDLPSGTGQQQPGGHQQQPSLSGHQQATQGGHQQQASLGGQQQLQPQGPARPKSALEQNAPDMAPSFGPKSRRDWIKEWEKANPGRVLPCSAKAVYRLADKLDLVELKARAFQHIIKSLSVANVAYEVFSSFSAAFEEVRKVQVDFFLQNWSEIRASEGIRNVWQQLRLGRHPGFEEVWPVIVLNLEYKPPSDRPAGDKRDAVAAAEV